MLLPSILRWRMPRQSKSARLLKTGNLLATLLGEKRHRVLPKELLDSTIKHLGGADAFARVIADILSDPAAPRLIKAKLIDAMIRLSQHVEQKSAPPIDLSVFSREDLEAALKDFLADSSQDAPEEDKERRSAEIPANPRPADIS
jgi:hypothetical protein